MRMQIILFIILTAIADKSSAQSSTFSPITWTSSFVNYPCNPYIFNETFFDISQGCLSNVCGWPFPSDWIAFGVRNTLPRYCPSSSCVNLFLWSPDGKYHLFITI